MSDSKPPLPPQDERLVATAGKLRGMYDRAGVEQPEENATAAPVLFVGTEKSRPPVQTLAKQISDLLSGRNLLFMRSKSIGTINMQTGEWEPMLPHDFCTWVSDVAGIVLVKYYETDDKSGKKKIIEGELGVDVARVILASRSLRTKLPLVEKINRVRLPVYRDTMDERGSEKRKGFRKMELLPEGYDAATKTFTIMGGLSYDEALDPGAALEWALHLIRDFQWGDEERSRSVFIQAFMTLFCRNLYIGKAPMFLFTSNLPGSGKSMLTRLCIEPVIGPELTSPSGWNREDRQETRKELDAAAQDFAQVMWFDDVDRCKVVSTDLNRWLTGSTWGCRVIGSKERFNGPLFAATFMTGNQVTLDDNIERRTLVVDLFARQKASDRPKAADRIELDEGFFQSEAMMKMCLAVSWALVKFWDASDRPVTKQRPIESFGAWSECVPSIVECCGFKRGLAPYESPDSGNQEGREWRDLAVALIQAHCIDKAVERAEVSMRDVIRMARLNGLFAEKLGSLDSVVKELQEKVEMKKWKWKPVHEPADDLLGTGDIEREPNEAEQRWQAAEWTDKATDSAWAKAFRKAAVAGQYFAGKDGKLYELGDRTAGKKASKFLLAVVR